MYQLRIETWDLFRPKNWIWWDQIQFHSGRSNTNFHEVYNLNYIDLTDQITMYINNFFVHLVRFLIFSNSDSVPLNLQHFSSVYQKRSLNIQRAISLIKYLNFIYRKKHLYHIFVTLTSKSDSTRIFYPQETLISKITNILNPKNSKRYQENF